MKLTADTAKWIIQQLSYLFISLVFMSCNSQSPTQSNIIASDGFIPLRAGNSWSFQRYDVMDTLGTLHASDVSEITILKDTIIGTQAWFQSNIPWPKGYTYTNKSQGCYLRGWYNKNITSDFMEYKYPALQNESYAVPIIYFGADSVWSVDSLRIVTVLSTDTLLTVAAGTFHCYHFRFQYNFASTHPNSNPFYDEFVSPGFGWIMKNFYNRNDSGWPRLSSTTILTSLQVQ